MRVLALALVVMLAGCAGSPQEPAGPEDSGPQGSPGTDIPAAEPSVVPPVAQQEAIAVRWNGSLGPEAAAGPAYAGTTWGATGSASTADASAVAGRLVVSWPTRSPTDVEMAVRVRACSGEICGSDVDGQGPSPLVFDLAFARPVDAVVWRIEPARPGSLQGTAAQPLQVDGFLVATVPIAQQPVVAVVGQLFSGTEEVGLAFPDCTDGGGAGFNAFDGGTLVAEPPGNGTAAVAFIHLLIQEAPTMVTSCYQLSGPDGELLWQGGPGSALVEVGGRTGDYRIAAHANGRVDARIEARAVLVQEG